MKLESGVDKRKSIESEIDCCIYNARESKSAANWFLGGGFVYAAIISLGLCFGSPKEKPMMALGLAAPAICFYMGISSYKDYKKTVKYYKKHPEEIKYEAEWPD